MKKSLINFVTFTLLSTQALATTDTVLALPEIQPSEFAGTIFVSGYGRNFYVISDTKGNVIMAELTRKQSADKAHAVAMRSHLTDFQLCVGKYNYDRTSVIISAQTECNSLQALQNNQAGESFKFSMYMEGIQGQDLVDGTKVKVKVSGVPIKVKLFAQKLDAGQIPPSLVNVFSELHIGKTQLAMK